MYSLLKNPKIQPVNNPTERLYPNIPPPAKALFAKKQPEKLYTLPKKKAPTMSVLLARKEGFEPSHGF